MTVDMQKMEALFPTPPPRPLNVRLAEWISDQSTLDQTFSASLAQALIDEGWINDPEDDEA